MTIIQPKCTSNIIATAALLVAMVVFVIFRSPVCAETVSSPSPPVQKKLAKETAEAVNRVPNVHLHPKQLEPVQLPPIKGFHPVKKLMRPLEQLQAQSIQLQQQIMRLEGPIAALQPSMLALEKKMVVVNRQIDSMQTQINAMRSQLRSVES